MGILYAVLPCRPQNPQLRLEENHVSEDGSLKEDCSCVPAVVLLRLSTQSFGHEDPLQHFGECLSMCVAELEALQGRIGGIPYVVCQLVRFFILLFFSWFWLVFRDEGDRHIRKK